MPVERDSRAPSARERWKETWSLVGLAAPDAALEDLIRRYDEPHRQYHHLGHVLDCLEKAAACRELQARPGLVELALWYHDVVYDPRRSDNEARSAERTTAVLDGRVAPVDAEAVCGMILDTRHQQAPGTADGAIVVDIDLSILGSPPAGFRAYDEAIRREYAWVPGFLYRRRRAAVLRSFLERPHIFTTPFFVERYEAQARANLERALETL